MVRAATGITNGATPNGIRKNGSGFIKRNLKRIGISVSTGAAVGGTYFGNEYNSYLRAVEELTVGNLGIDFSYFSTIVEAVGIGFLPVAVITFGLSHLAGRFSKADRLKEVDKALSDNSYTSGTVHERVELILKKLENTINEYQELFEAKQTLATEFKGREVAYQKEIEAYKETIEENYNNLQKKIRAILPKFVGSNEKGLTGIQEKFEKIRAELETMQINFRQSEEKREKLEQQVSSKMNILEQITDILKTSVDDLPKEIKNLIKSQVNKGKMTEHS
ncbi:hypothetical protein ACFL52_05215, partial [Candidatus Margulisiibacteriota bacterium]